MAEKLLTDRQCKTAKPKHKVRYLNDGAGLRLLIKPDGAKSWVLRYWIGGKENAMGLGAYPGTTLEEARNKARDARKLADEGRSPAIERKLRVAENISSDASTFKSVAQAWLDENRPHWSSHHYERNEGLLRRIFYPALGDIPIADITELAIAMPLRKAYDSGIHDSARKARQIVVQLFGYAKRNHLVKFNPARELAADREFLPKHEVEGFAALHADEVGPFLKKLSASNCPPVTQAALQMLLYTGLREGALRAAKWSEVDLEAAAWTLPFDRRKRRTKTKNLVAARKAASAKKLSDARRDFVLPLPKQAVRVLTELAKLTNKGPESYVFASDAAKDGYLAENTLRLALHGLGFKVTAHGFRSLLTDLLAEKGFNVEAVERQLDHTLGHLQPDREANPVRRHYLRTDFLDYRRGVMQWVADWADAQRAGKKSPALPKNVVELRAA